MYKIINKMLMELPSKMNSIANTPAVGLPEDEAQLKHYLAEKLLYLCRRTRQDV